MLELVEEEVAGEVVSSWSPPACVWPGPRLPGSATPYMARVRTLPQAHLELHNFCRHSTVA